jgi:lysophospholipase L1-like esterase
MTVSRKLLFGAIATCLFAGILEGAGAIVDARYGFRARLFEALDNLERRSRPLAPGPLTWPDDTIRLRVAGPPPSNETYVVGQRVIPGASDTGYQAFLKPDGLANEPRKRIFIVGESAAFGYPYPLEFSFGNMLQKRLADEYVVLNAGQISWGSPNLVPLVARIVEHYQPAAIILFVGNNEWQHWSGLDQLTTVNRAGRVLRVAGSSRAVAALAWWWLRQATADRPTVARDFVPRYQLEGIDYALAHPAERYGSPAVTAWRDARSMFVDAFRRNLTEMVTTAQGRGVRVVLMPTPMNYRLSPAWSHPQPESYNQSSSAAVRELLKRAVDQGATGSNAEALKAIDQALSMDSDPPMLHYVRGEVLRAMGRHAEAEAAYATARERMVGHLGSPLSFQAVVREVAGATSAELVDVPRLFDEYEHRINSFYNEHLIADDCHPTPLGHRVIADALTPLFRK